MKEQMLLFAHKCLGQSLNSELEFACNLRLRQMDCFRSPNQLTRIYFDDSLHEDTYARHWKSEWIPKWQNGSSFNALHTVPIVTY